MNLAPATIDAMSLWEFSAMTAGFARFHGAEEQPEAPSDDEFDAMLQRAGFA